MVPILLPRPHARTHSSLASRNLRIALLFLVTFTFAPQAWGQDEHTNGRWLGPYGAADWGKVAVHAALLRGDSLGASHSQVVVWDLTPQAKLWKWDPGDSVPRVAKLLSPASAISNVFCSGHSTLPDGRLFVAGGSYNVLDVGLEHTNLFRPSNSSWARQADMAYGRWYPTNTTLADGKVLITSGSEYARMLVFGGRESSGSPQDTLNPLALWGKPFWETSTLQGGTKPPAREGHSLSYSTRTDTLILFGGKTSGGALLNDVWAAKRTDDSTWKWTQLNPDTSSHGTPPARWRHSAVLYPADTSLVMFGGRNGAGDPLGDVWKLYLHRMGSGGQWKKLSPSGTPPTPRYGHSAVFDPGPTGTSGQERMLVFGGLEPASALSDTVWALSLPDGQPPAWSVVALRTGSSVPTAREAHAALFDPGPRKRAESGGNKDERRMVVFGGRNGSTRYSDVWMLWIPDDATLQPVWESVVPDPDPNQNPGTPAARAEHSASPDQLWDRVVFFGGDLSTGLSEEIWSFNLNYYQPDGQKPRWLRLVAPRAPSPRAGHAAAYDPVLLFTRIPERYDPSTGSLSKLTQLNKLLPWYPFMFVLPSGKLFYGGPDLNTQLLDLAAGWDMTHTSNFSGGSAAMYRPGKVLKCGGVLGGNVVDSTARIAFDPTTNATTGWRDPGPLPAQPMMKRNFHNLTLLPTGQVLVTGGKNVNNPFADSTFSEQRVQIWTPAAGETTGTWSATLAREPAVRAYHSTALLLPDGRVLSAGGGPGKGLGADDSSQFRATIYEPPYLFNAQDQYATRPVIGGAPGPLGYNQSFTLCTSGASSISKVCLIRPAAVTHAFDQNQRYVPLGFTAYTNPSRLIATAPLSANLAPPGDYLLFLVDNSSVPAIARWIRLGSTLGTDSCDAVRPAPITDLRTVVHCTNIEVKWTAPGDDSLTGSAKEYDLRVSSSAITSSNFYQATRILIDPPLSPGSAELYTDEVGECSAYRYYAIKTADDAPGPNWSALSNLPHGARTPCPPPQCMDKPIQLARIVEPVRELFALEPNPVHDQMSVRFGVPEEKAGSALEIVVYDVAGRRVATVERGTARIGYHKVFWDLTDQAGGRVSSGLYFVRFKLGDTVLKRRVIAVQ